MRAPMGIPYRIGHAGNETTGWRCEGGVSAAGILLRFCPDFPGRGPVHGGMDFYCLFKYTISNMYGSADPDLKRHTLYFLGGFAAVALGFMVLLAGFFADSEPVLYTGAGFMCCAAAVQCLLLFSQSRAS